MKQNANKFGLMLMAITLAVLLVGTAAIVPTPVNAQDGGDGVTIRDTSGIEGSGAGEPVTPGFSTPAENIVLFEQPPLEPWVLAYWSDKGMGNLCMEDFWGLTEDIYDIHWYGISQDSGDYSDCDPTGMKFQIVFYQDDGGYPGAPVATFSNVSPTITYLYTSGLSVYRFDVADLGAPVSLTQGWVSVQSTYSPNGCFFAWIISLVGNNNLIQDGIPFAMNLAFALTGGPTASNLKYLHSTGGLFNLTEPLGTQWHELWPIFCREYHLSSWEDNGDGVLSYCDQIDMYEKPDGELRDYHVEEVTITLFVTPMETGDPMYIELEGGFNETVLWEPIDTQWHEIYPVFCTRYQLTGVDWECEPPLGHCDYIWLLNKQTRVETKWHVEEVAIDIIVTPKPPPVGGEAYPVSKMFLLAPWIALGVVLAGGTGWCVLRRRRAQS
jgi:hypothetical protein